MWQTVNDTEEPVDYDLVTYDDVGSSTGWYASDSYYPPSDQDLVFSDLVRLAIGWLASRLYGPPGLSLLHFTQFFLTRKCHSVVLQPTIRDLQDEYYEMLAEGRKWTARWVHLRGCWIFCIRVVPESLVKELQDAVRKWL